MTQSPKKRREDAHALGKFARNGNNVWQGFCTNCFWSAMRLRIAFGLIQKRGILRAFAN
jgi:hypothetical protein